jgi:hypothetical protein
MENEKKARDPSRRFEHKSETLLAVLSSERPSTTTEHQPQELSNKDYATHMYNNKKNISLRTNPNIYPPPHLKTAPPNPQTHLCSVVPVLVDS